MVKYVIAMEHSDRGNPEDWSPDDYASRSDLYCGDRHATLAMTGLRIDRMTLILFVRTPIFGIATPRKGSRNDVIKILQAQNDK